jgi:hypothetical protein
MLCGKGQNPCLPVASLAKPPSYSVSLLTWSHCTVLVDRSLGFIAAEGARLLKILNGESLGSWRPSCHAAVFYRAYAANWKTRNLEGLDRAGTLLP